MVYFRVKLRFLVLVLFVSLLACHQHKNPRIPDCKPPPCEHKVPYSIDPTFSKANKDMIRRAAADWYEETEHRVCLYEDVWEEEPKSNATIKVNMAISAEVMEILTGLPPNSGAIGVYRFYYNDIWIALEDFGADKLEGIMAHEFGHSLGLPHTIDTRIPSVMHPVVDYDAVSAPHVRNHDYGEICRVRGCKCSP